MVRFEKRFIPSFILRGRRGGREGGRKK